MKTITEWLNELPEPYRTQALANITVESSLVPSIKDAVQCAFFWLQSPEGDIYWRDLFITL